MVARLLRFARLRKKSGHILVLAAVMSIVIVMIVGLVIDSGLVYGKRAHLSKAADAAALAGISNVSLGDLQAKRVAEDVFHSNYPFNPSDTTEYQAPTIDVQFILDPINNNKTIVIEADVYAAPLFGQLLGITQFDLSARAQASRAKLVLSLVLDRSGSMQGNQGCIALPPAAHTFVDFFDDTGDRMSLTTYASHARLDVSMRQPFKTDVHAAVPDDCLSEYGGFTFIDGGLELARQENASVVLNPGEDVIKVVVLFTDGLANIFQGTFDCPPQTLYNLSGSDSGNNVYVIDPQTGVQVCQSFNGGSFSCCPQLVDFLSINLNTLPAQGANAGQNVRQEGKDRAKASARIIRDEGNVIYTIGLGTNLDPDFLMEIANDPRSPAFDSTEPAGEFAQAPTAADLQDVFLRIARKIALRLSV